MIRKKMGKEDWEQNEKDLSCHNQWLSPCPIDNNKDKIFTQDMDRRGKVPIYRDLKKDKGNCLRKMKW